MSNIIMPKYQRTIKKEVVIKSIGQHSGKIVGVKIYPADVDNGIVFIDNTSGKPVRLKLQIDNISAESGCTNIGNIHTIEHMLSAIFGMGIDNLNIEAFGIETPIVDGSAIGFVKQFERVGIVEQNAKRKYLKVVKPVEFYDEKSDTKVQLLPNEKFNGLLCDVKIVFDTKAIGIQTARVVITPENYRKEIALARTFARLKDIEFWHSKGFALGASLKTGIGVDDKRVLNKEGLRFKNEFARHKILDAVGDLSTCGYPVIAEYHSFKGGHMHNNALLKKLMSDKSNYEIIEL